jgi:hypothetical protein
LGPAEKRKKGIENRLKKTTKSEKIDVGRVKKKILAFENF